MLLDTSQQFDDRRLAIGLDAPFSVREPAQTGTAVVYAHKFPGVLLISVTFQPADSNSADISATVFSLALNMPIIYTHAISAFFLAQSPIRRRSLTMISIR